MHTAKPILRHIVWWDELGKLYRKSLCGKFVTPKEEADESHPVTCESCKTRKAELEELDI